ncbi:MAG: hypothetical protein IVW54_00320 [Candidatus Binataceae bacterium]|nr:hypothetical protein [Candidatus Binataceae bacterium]
MDTQPFKEAVDETREYLQNGDVGERFTRIGRDAFNYMSSTSRMRENPFPAIGLAFGAGYFLAKILRGWTFPILVGFGIGALARQTSEGSISKRAGSMIDTSAASKF